MGAAANVGDGDNLVAGILELVLGALLLAAAWRLRRGDVPQPRGGTGRTRALLARFEHLTPVFASDRLPAPEGLDAAPYGKGSRVAIAGPPGAGATTMLRRIVATLADAQPDLAPIVVLAGVRPEEVTEWRRDADVTVAGGGFDGSVEEQAQIAEMAIERAVEAGRDAVVAIDSLDSLPPSVARRVFGAARRAEEGGSLTVVAVTGEAPEPLRVATTRIVLERGAAGPASGTTRADLLS